MRDGEARCTPRETKIAIQLCYSEFPGETVRTQGHSEEALQLVIGRGKRELCVSTFIVVYVERNG